jgi:methyl-accepting chemotaxis protein
MGHMGNNRRRNFFINKDFQIRFILKFVLTSTLWAIATITFFAYFAKKRLQDALYTTHLKVSSPGDILLSSALLAQAIALILFIVLLAYAIYTLRKKLSVPLYMLEKDVARIADGDLVTVVSLREEDEFQALASDMNTMRKELGQKLSKIKEGQTVLASAVSELHRAALKGNPSANHVGSLKDAVARMKEELNVFTC